MKCVPEDEVNCVVEVQVSAITSNAERRMQAVSSPCTIEAADEAAIAWYVRLTAQAPSTEARDAFLAWHDSQASHAAAYARVIRALGVADTVLVDPITPPELFTIEPIAAASTLPFTQRARQRSKPWLRAMQWVTAACCIVLIGYSLALLRAPDYVLVETRTGERRQLRLPDGSTIHLNTATRLEFAIDQRTRAVRFESGEAFFDVAPDVTRPFVIALGDRDVRVV